MRLEPFKQVARTALGVALLAAGCGAASSGVDSATGPDTGAGDAAFPAIAAGVFTTHVPSAGAGTEGIAVRVFHPATAARRYPEGAPVAIFAPGGHDPGSLPPESPIPDDVAAHGYVLVTFLLPGGRAGDVASGGIYDYRGPNCTQALADIVRYARGQTADSDGKHLADRVPFALAGDVGVLGSSNGGNLALTTFASHAADLAGLAWFVAWESPIGDQAVLVELSDGPVLNPYYVAGTSTVTTCPWPGMEVALAFDPDAPAMFQDPVSGTMLPLAGRLFLDADRNGAFDAGELAFTPLGGPGSSPAMPEAYFSAELTQAVDGQRARLFPAGAPPWLAARADVQSYWAERDGSLVIGAAHQALPDLFVISLASQVDHVQKVPDHPHVRGHIRGWIDAGHGFVRLNPDAAYMARVTGKPASAFPDNAANEPVPYPGIDATLEPEMVDALAIDEELSVAGVLEAADRARANDHAPNLAVTLVP